MTCCEATKEMKSRVAERIVERTGMERDIFVRDSQAFGRVLDRIAATRGMAREDVALELTGTTIPPTPLRQPATGVWSGIRETSLSPLRMQCPSIGERSANCSLPTSWAGNLS